MQLNNPMQLKRYALLLSLLIISLAGCDSGGENEPSERTYTIRYELSGTFETCTVTYANASDGITQNEVELPWDLEFERTITELGSYLAQFSPSCINFDEERSASAALIIDGERFEEGEETGSSVSFSFDARLTLDGPETF